MEGGGPHCAYFRDALGLGSGVRALVEWLRVCCSACLRFPSVRGGGAPGLGSGEVCAKEPQVCVALDTWLPSGPLCAVSQLCHVPGGAVRLGTSCYCVWRRVYPQCETVVLLFQ